MQQYRVVFTKRLCNDVGLQRNCIQAIISVRCSKSEERAVRAAQKRFERLKHIPHWNVYADKCETLGLDARVRAAASRAWTCAALDRALWVAKHVDCKVRRQRGIASGAA